MSEERILTERRGHVLVITINRPEARNAFDGASAQAMAAAIDRLDAEDDLFVGVITGDGFQFQVVDTKKENDFILHVGHVGNPHGSRPEGARRIT